MTKYLSRYSPDKKITIHQYIVEYVCENNARHSNRELPIQFWTLPEWEAFFVVQMKFCNRLCKTHDAQKVLDFVKQKRIYNLMPKWISGAVEQWHYIPPKEGEEKRERQSIKSIGRKINKNTIFDKIRKHEC